MANEVVLVVDPSLAEQVRVRVRVRVRVGVRVSLTLTLTLALTLTLTLILTPRGVGEAGPVGAAAARGHARRGGADDLRPDPGGRDP